MTELVSANLKCVKSVIQYNGKENSKATIFMDILP